MALRLHQTIWENQINRTIIFSFLMVVWTLLIELYFIFFPIDLIKQNLFLGWLYTDIFGYQFLLDAFHLIIWGLCFFFTWITFVTIKEVTRLAPASISEYTILTFVFVVFVVIFTNIFVGILFVGLSFVEFLYMYLSLGR